MLDIFLGVVTNVQKWWILKNWNFWFLSELLSAVVTQNPNHQTFSISTGADPNNGVQLKIQLSQSQNQSQYHNGGYSSALLAKYILQLLLERQEAAATATPIATTESTTALSTTLSTTTTTTTVSLISFDRISWNFDRSKFLWIGKNRQSFNVDFFIFIMLTSFNSS